MIGTTTVSIKGDSTLRKALRAVAASRGVSIAELVRAAVDDVYGDELKPHIIFFNSDGTKIFQPEHKRTKKEQSA